MYYVPVFRNHVFAFRSPGASSWLDCQGRKLLALFPDSAFPSVRHISSLCVCPVLLYTWMTFRVTSFSAEALSREPVLKKGLSFSSVLFLGVPSRPEVLWELFIGVNKKTCGINLLTSAALFGTSNLHQQDIFMLFWKSQLLLLPRFTSHRLFFSRVKTPRGWIEWQFFFFLPTGLHLAELCTTCSTLKTHFYGAPVQS